MTLGQVVSVSDTGRRRRNNEDVFVCEPPLFAIADGMGGAQAGEVASGLAAEALHEHARDGRPGEQLVTALVQEANRRVYERASTDAALTGMGTTLTLALVDEDKVVLGHVGDSRAYLLRNGGLEQITNDHSLVAELTRAGKLSEEEAEVHPQRSVITRALGTDPDVDADVFTIETRDGDVFLICSDGLTDMVDDKTIRETLEQHRGNLKKAAQMLVRAANRGGGEDNITILLFEIAGAADRTQETVPAAPVDEEVDDEEDTLSGLERVPAVGARPDEWTVDGDVPEAALERPVERRRGRARLYWLAGGVVLLAVVGLAVFGFSQAHFVGAQRDGHVALYQGIPYDIAGIHLYRTVYISPIVAAQLTQSERQRLFDHDLRSYDSGRDAIRRYEQEIEPFETAEQATSTVSAPTATETTSTTTKPNRAVVTNGHSWGPGQPRPEEQGGP